MNVTQVNGQIQDSQGTPVPQALVQLRNAAGGLVATAVTDAEGHFDANVISAGPFQVEVSDGSVQQSQMVDPASSENFVMRLSTVHAGTPAAAPADTVSLNDLEAPKAARSKLAKAEKALDERHFDQAWSLANEAVTAAPEWGQAYFVRGVLNLEYKHYPAARADLTKALQENPHNPGALTEMGKLYSTTGAYDLSEAYLRQALQLPPVMWPTYWEMATLDLDRGRYADAATMAADAEYATPSAPVSVHYLAGLAAYHLKHWSQARIEFGKYVELASKSPTPPDAASWTAKARELLATIPKSTPAEASAGATPAATPAGTPAATPASSAAAATTPNR